jgi:hypothetical protein
MSGLFLEVRFFVFCAHWKNPVTTTSGNFVDVEFGITCHFMKSTWGFSQFDGVKARIIVKKRHSCDDKGWQEGDKLDVTTSHNVHPSIHPSIHPSAHPSIYPPTKDNNNLQHLLGAGWS